MRRVQGAKTWTKPSLQNQNGASTRYSGSFPSTSDGDCVARRASRICEEPNADVKSRFEQLPQTKALAIYFFSRKKEAQKEKVIIHDGNERGDKRRPRWNESRELASGS